MQARQTELFEGAGAAGLCGPHLRRVSAAVQLVHLRSGCTHLLAQLRRERNAQTAARLCIEQRAGENFAAKHFLQAHGLCAQLQFIAAVLLRHAALILDRVRQSQTAFSGKRDPVYCITLKFHHVALSAQSQRERLYAQAADNPQIAVAVLVHNTDVHGSLAAGPIMRAMMQEALQQ